MMRRYIQRDSYLQKLIVRKDNGEVKVITGPRRSGKSFLLDPIYKDYLIGKGIPENHIISVSFDIEDEDTPKELLDLEKLRNTCIPVLQAKMNPITSSWTRYRK